MVKLKGPGMAIAASGKLGGALVFSHWKDQPYMRVLTKPTNPKSAGQVSIRAMLKFLTQEWDGMPDAPKETYDEAAAAKQISPFNLFVGQNQLLWRNYQAPRWGYYDTPLNPQPDHYEGTATPGIRSLTIHVAPYDEHANWGVVLFRSPTGTFTPTWDKAIAVLPVDGSYEADYVDSPLASGTYYYDTLPFQNDGVQGTAYEEFNGTIP